MFAALIYLRKNLALTGLIVFLLIGIPVTMYFLSPNHKTAPTVLGTTEQKVENKITEKEAKALLNKIGTLMDLPKDEMPTIGTVTNKVILPSQPFYTNAENGDRVLIYLTAQKAILYRPSTNRIIEVSTITNMTPTPGTGSTVTTASGTQTNLNPEPNSKRRRILKSPSEKEAVK